MERLIKWKVDVIKSHEWFATCPTCDSLNTEEIHVTKYHNGVEVTRRCNTCLYEWKTGVWGEPDFDDYDDEDYGTEPVSPPCPHCNGRGDWDGFPCEFCHGTGREWWL